MVRARHRPAICVLAVGARRDGVQMMTTAAAARRRRSLGVRGRRA
jgi:hypothetical protein